MTVNVGMNVLSLSYFTSEVPFLNLLKNSSFNVSGVTPGVWNGTTFSTSVTAPSTSGTSIISIASPAVISWTSHNLVAGAGVIFSTTGSLPTGITAGTRYLVSATGLTANSFQITDQSGNTITTSGSQSGTQTVQTDELYNLYNFYLDANGYPISVTTTAGSQPGSCPQAGWNSVMYMFGLATTGVMKSGNYVLQYSGTGTFAVNWQTSNTQTAGGTGRIIINMPSNDSNLSVIIVSTGSGSTYAKNLSVVYSPDSTAGGVIGIREALLNNGEIFNPDFIARMKPFKTIRFMPWANTVLSSEVNWVDRSPLNWVTWCDVYFKGAGSVPIEVMCALCNELGADAWFNIPFMATLDYVRRHAQLVKSLLNTSLRAYVEFANEVWNVGAYSGIFSQYLAIARAALPGFNDFNTAFNYGEILMPARCRAIWKDVFTPLPSSVIGMAAGQSSFISRNWHDILQAAGSPYNDGTVAQVTTGNPTVINWTGHPLSINQPIMFPGVFASFDQSTNTWGAAGSLPTGLSSTVTYFVLSTNFTANSFEISTTIGGSPVVTSGGNSNPGLMYWAGPAGFAATITSGNPTVVNMTAHGLVAGTPIAFMGVLPSGMTCNVTYYVMSAGLTTNSFQITASPNGPALSTTGSSSGVQPIYFGGITAQNVDALAIAPYFGYETPNSWSTDLANLFQEINGPSLLPTVSMGNLGGGPTAYTLTSGLSLPANPPNSTIISFNLPTGTNNAGATLAVDGGTAFPILDHYGIPILASVLTNQGSGFFYYASMTTDTIQHNIAATLTITIATSLFTLNNHGLQPGQFVCFETTGSLPTGITAGTVYYVTEAGTFDANNFQVSTNPGQFNSPITLSGSQSGTQTLFVVGWRICGVGPNSASPSPEYPSTANSMMSHTLGEAQSDYFACAGYPTGAIPLIGYEAGQSLIAVGGGNPNDAVNQAYYLAAMSDQRMLGVYKTFFNGWNSINPGGLICNFADIGEPTGFGFWGVLNTINDAHSPRYDALVQIATPPAPVAPIGHAMVEG